MSPKGTYAGGVRALQRECEGSFLQPRIFQGEVSVARPLTLEETILAILHQANSTTWSSPDAKTPSEKRELTEYWFDTASAIVCVPGRPLQLRYIPLFRGFFNRDPRDQDTSIQVDIEDIQSRPIELRNSLVNTRLTRTQAKNHKGWRSIIDSDSTYRAFIELVYSVTLGQPAMEFRTDTFLPNNAHMVFLGDKMAGVGCYPGSLVQSPYFLRLVNSREECSQRLDGEPIKKPNYHPQEPLLLFSKEAEPSSMHPSQPSVADPTNSAPHVEKDI